MLLIILINQDFLYRGDDAVDIFCSKINEIRDEIKERMQENKEIEMTAAEEKNGFWNCYSLLHMWW